MAEETLVVSSSTDGQQAVEDAAQGTSDGVPVSESSLQNFAESADGDVLTYENPQSERQALLQRLAEAEREVMNLPEAPDESQPADQSIDMEAVRRAATGASGPFDYFPFSFCQALQQCLSFARPVRSGRTLRSRR